MRFHNIQHKDLVNTSIKFEKLWMSKNKRNLRWKL